MPFGRGWFGRGGGWGRGNPYPFCRFYPWLPRRWWAYGMGFYPRPYGGAQPHRMAQAATTQRHRSIQAVTTHGGRR